MGFHARRMDHRGHREDDDRREHPWTEPGHHLGDRDEPDRTGGLDAILDLTGVAELGGQLQSDGLDSWNMIEIATTPGTSTVAKADSATDPASADALADRGET